MKWITIGLFVMCCWSCSPDNVKIDNSLKKYFDENKVDGCFALYENGIGQFTIYNLARYRDSAFLPASTFKIVNSLIGLQTGKIVNDSMIIKWDGIKRPFDSWNKDLTMYEAFRVSAVPYYQEVARRIGKDTMQFWLDSLSYGTKKITSRIDTFWLDNSLKIKPDEELGLVKRLYFNQLPFFKTNQEIVKRAMLFEDNSNYKLSYKTGWGFWNETTKKHIGWITGWIEENRHPYFFVLNFESPDRHFDMQTVRMKLLKEILAQYGFYAGQDVISIVFVLNKYLNKNHLSYQFEYTFFFWLLAGIPVFILLFLLLLRWKKKTMIRIGDPRFVKELIREYSPKLFNAKFTLLSVAFAAGVIAATNLRKPGDADSIMRKGIDVVIALDVSKSMYAVDLQPNRLERAKQLIIKLMDEMPDDRIGLVLFAGRAYLQMPLTTDHGAAKLFVNSASPDAIANQGTVIADALQMSANAFNGKERRFKSVVLISDGEDHDENALLKADELSGQGVMINTVGVGSAEGSKIVDPTTGENKKDAMGNEVITRLNETELKQIAEKTNGAYIHMESTDETVNALMKQLSQIDRKAYGDLSLMNFTTYYYWFAGFMFLLLVIENFIPEKKKIKSEK